MPDDTLFRCLLDHGLMYLPWNIALGKFGKGPRKGGFTWYFAGQYPPAQVPHSAVDLKAFDQVSCGGNVPMCLCYKGSRQINSIT